MKKKITADYDLHVHILRVEYCFPLRIFTANKNIAKEIRKNFYILLLTLVINNLPSSTKYFPKPDLTTLVFIIPGHTAKKDHGKEILNNMQQWDLSCS